MLIPLLNISLPIDPSGNQAIYNNQSLDLANKVPGLLASIVTPFATTGTAINKFLSWNLPIQAVGGGAVALGAFGVKPGMGFEFEAWGFNPADANVRTLTFLFGATSIPLVITGSGLLWRGRALVYMNAIAAGACVQQVNADAFTSTPATVGPSQPASTVDITAAATTLSINLTTATSGITTCNGATIKLVN